jgi:hypothetical protein
MYEFLSLKQHTGAINNFLRTHNFQFQECLNFLSVNPAFRRIQKQDRGLLGLLYLSLIMVIYGTGWSKYNVLDLFSGDEWLESRLEYQLS